MERSANQEAIGHLTTGLAQLAQLLEMRASPRVMLKPHDESVAEIREAIAAYRATGARFQSTCHLVLLAQVLAACRSRAKVSPR